MKHQRIFLCTFFVGLSFVYVHTVHAADAGKRSVEDLKSEDLKVICKAGQLRTIDVSFQGLTSLVGIMKYIEDQGVLAIKAINNRLGEGPDELPVEGLVLMRALYLTSNALKTAHLRLFGSLQHITDLMLANNKITDDILPILKSLKKLQNLCLSGNELTALDMGGDDFELPHLKKLDVSSNKITSVRVGGVSASNLQELLLANNQLTCIERGMLRGHNVMRLDLSSNTIVTICEDALADLPVLAFLNVRGNDALQKPTPAALAGPNNVKIDADYDSPFAHLDAQEFKNVCPREVYVLPNRSLPVTSDVSRSCAIA
jgi:hypothetical protein